MKKGIEKCIEAQQEQRRILDRITHPYTAAELQELAENEGWD